MKVFGRADVKTPLETFRSPHAQLEICAQPNPSHQLGPSPSGKSGHHPFAIRKDPATNPARPGFFQFLTASGGDDHVTVPQQSTSCNKPLAPVTVLRRDVSLANAGCHRVG